MPYLTDVKGFTNESVADDIFPVSIYASLVFYLVAGPVSRRIGLKTFVLVGATCKLWTRILLVWGTSLGAMQFTQVLFAAGTSADAILLAYAYAVAREDDVDAAARRAQRGREDLGPGARGPSQRRRRRHLRRRARRRGRARADAARPGASMKSRHLSILLTCAVATAQAPLPEALPRGWRRTDDAVVGAPHAALLGRGVTLRAPTATTTSACRRLCGSSCKGVRVLRGMVRIWRRFCRVIRMVLFVLGKGVDGRG